MKPLDLILQNGTVYEPATGTFSQEPLFISGGKIVDRVPDNARVLDVSGCLVTPGLIDYHLHVFNGGTAAGEPVDLVCLPNGVTTCMDGGSAGCANYPIFHNTQVVPSRTRLLAMLNLASAGLVGPQAEDIRPCAVESQRIEETFARYPELKALKLRASRGIMVTEDTLTFATELAGKLGCRVVAHVTDPALPMERIAELLRPGDVLCHMYQGRGDTILDADGQVKPQIRAARERGVVFDACHGRNNYSLPVAQAAIRQGFAPDIISSDMNEICYYLTPAVSLPYIMSKHLALGMPLQAVLDAATKAPAALLGLPELGTLAVGTTADVAVFRLKEKAATFDDVDHVQLPGRQVLVPQITIKGGGVAYCQVDCA